MFENQSKMMMKLQIFTTTKFLRWSNHSCLAIISLDSALKKDENYYLQVLLKECKYIENKVIRHIIDDIERSSDDFDKNRCFG